MVFNTIRMVNNPRLKKNPGERRAMDRNQKKLLFEFRRQTERV